MVLNDPEGEKSQKLRQPLTALLSGNYSEKQNRYG